MNKILIISRAETDLERLILANCPNAGVVRYAGADVPDLEKWDALAILGGTEEEPLSSPSIAR